MRMHTNVLTLCSIATVALTVAFLGTAPVAADQSAAFQGVWRTAEVTVPGPAAATLTPAATLAIFYGRHYSRVEVQTDAPRPTLSNPATASAEQLRAAWGPFAGEAGTFELSADKLTMQATVAKNPAAMTKGAVSVFSYRLEGDVLTLTQVRTHAGPASSPVTITLIRVE